MIEVAEFLASHPEVAEGERQSSVEVPQSAGTPKSKVPHHTPEGDSPSASLSTISHGSSRRKPRLAPTHAEPVSSPYTSGFGGSLDDEDTGWAPRGKSRYHRGRSGGASHKKGRRYRSGAPVRRVPDDPNDLDACREAALTLLDAAPRPSLGLRKRLIAKGYGEVVVDDVIARLKDVHLIDDEAYAQSAIRSCVARQMGMRGTLMELRRKDVDADTANAQVRLAQEQGVFEDAAWELGRRSAKKTEGLDLQVRRRRFWSAGGRKGHDPETLRRVAHELFG